MAEYAATREQSRFLGRILGPLAKVTTASVRKLHYVFHELQSLASARSLTLVHAAKTENQLTVYTVIRDELHQLPQFLDHYRKLGFGHFCIVDNGSRDRAVEFLSTQTDVTVYHTNASFRKARFGSLWQHSLIKKDGLNRWVCIVDADEYLVFPTRFGNSVQAVIAELESAGQKRLLAPMVDLYRIDDSGDEYFDASPEIVKRERRGINVWGGVRMRLARQNDPQDDGPILSKYPLNYYDRHAFFNEPHFPHPHDRNTISFGGRLLHRKMTTWSRERIEALIAQNQHWNGSVEYKKYSQWINLPLRSESSKLYNGPDDLVTAGLLGEGP